MKCLNCNKELFKIGRKMKDESFCTEEILHFEWTENGEEYLECKHCKAKNFIKAGDKNQFTISHFSINE